MLIKICKSLGLCLSQLVPNSLLSYACFREKLERCWLSVTVDSFHALFTTRQTIRLLYFISLLGANANFLEKNTSN